MPAGRPTEYDEKRTPLSAKILCRLGATDKDLAEAFGVSEQTINTWKHKYPKFLESLKTNKTEADMAVVASLFKRAIGFDYEEEEITYNKDEEITRRKVVKKKVLPDVTAQIYWTKNRLPEYFRDVYEHQHNMTLADAMAECTGIEKEKKGKK